jgi:ribosomal protein S3AE
MTSEQYLAHALNSEKKLLALIDEFTAQIYPLDSPSYRKAEIRKEEFVHALTQAYLLGKRTS